MKTIGKFSILGLFSLLSVAGTALTHGQGDPSFANKIGISLDGLGDGGRGKPFIDLGKTLRPWVKVGGSDPAPIDDNGWPTSDAATVLFDVRPFGTWKPPADDPDNFQPDWSGTYKMSFLGQATISFNEEMRPQIQQQKYDPATNTTTADLIVPKGVGLVAVKFTDTKRLATDSSGTGITMLRVMRPGYGLDDKTDFNDAYIRSLKPFGVLRFMDFLSTNHGPGFYGDAGHHALEWRDRHVPTDATQADYGTKYGGSWEYVIELAKLTGKDIWINIPVAATDNYVRTLAAMLKDKLPPKCNIYIEHSNEVWNFGFPQYVYNKLAAVDEVAQGNSKLNSDGSKDQEVWAHRRHAERLIQIGDIFREAFASDDVSRVRPVYASWLISAGPHFDDVMAWVEKNYGPPKDYFYALADAGYYNPDKVSADAGIDELLRAMRASSDANEKFRAPIQRIADHYGLKHFQYEAGPGTDGTEDLANRIRVSRDPGMKDLVVHDAQDNWFARGGDIYIYFSHIDAYARFGCWGLSEDIDNLNTPKWQAIYQLTGTAPPK